jgi:hypothetical protein
MTRSTSGTPEEKSARRKRRTAEEDFLAQPSHFAAFFEKIEAI